MEYLSQVIPLPTSKDDPTVRAGDIGILNYKRDFLIVHYLSCDTEEEVATYRILAKCADKFLVHKIREACEQRLEHEHQAEVEKARVKVQEMEEWGYPPRDGKVIALTQPITQQEEWDCSCKPAEYGIGHCLDDSCPYTSACPNYLP